MENWIYLTHEMYVDNYDRIINYNNIDNGQNEYIVEILEFLYKWIDEHILKEGALKGYAEYRILPSLTIAQAILESGWGSFNDSIEDHNKLLNNARYKPVRECSNYREACRKIYECGYATDPVYPEKLIKIIEENKLYEFDNAYVLSEVTVSMEDGKILKFQALCNRLGIRDYEGKALAEDNKLGPRTRSCIETWTIIVTT